MTSYEALDKLWNTSTRSDEMYKAICNDLRLLELLLERVYISDWSEDSKFVGMGDIIEKYHDEYRVVAWLIKNRERNK